MLELQAVADDWFFLLQTLFDKTKAPDVAAHDAKRLLESQASGEALVSVKDADYMNYIRRKVMLRELAANMRKQVGLLKRGLCAFSQSMQRHSGFGAP